MAVKIIREGSKPTVTCSCCRSVLEYDIADVDTDFNGRVYIDYITCPKCLYRINFLSRKKSGGKRIEQLLYL